MNQLLLEQAVIDYRVKHILDTPHLKAKYLAIFIEIGPIPLIISFIADSFVIINL